MFALLGLGMPEIIVICAIGLLLFGGSLPTLARSLGKGIMEFKKGVSGMQDDLTGGA